MRPAFRKISDLSSAEIDEMRATDNERPSRGHLRRDERNWWAERAAEPWVQIVDVASPLTVLVRIGKDAKGAPARTGLLVEHPSYALTDSMVKSIQASVKKSDKELYEAGGVMKNAKTARRAKPGRPRLSDEYLRKVARTHTKLKSRHPKGFMEQVAAALDTDLSTAKGRVEIARKRGFLKD